MRIFFPIMMAVATSIVSFNCQIQAHCARCTKIEVERAEEQAKHPQKAGYYDDAIHLHADSDQKQTNSAKEETETSGTTKPQEKSTPSSTLLTSTLLAQASPPSRLKSDQQQVSFENDSQQHSILLTILQTKDFLNTLAGPFTLFVPTNEALYKLKSPPLQDLGRAENRDLLTTLVANHVVTQKLLEDGLVQTPIKTLSGRNLLIRAQQGQLKVNDAHILRVIPVGSNGIIYVIDQVLFP